MKKRNGILARVGIVALVLTLVTSTMTSGTLARYTSESRTTLTAVAAAWNPDISYSVAQATSGTINLADTIDTANLGAVTNALASDVIAPGVKGGFNVTIDTKQSQTDIDYAVYIFYDSADNIPENFIFSAKGESTSTGTGTIHGVTTADYAGYKAGTKAIPSDVTPLVSNTLNYSSTAQGNTTTVNITWEWPYQTEPAGGVSQSVEDGEDNTAASQAMTEAGGFEYCVVVLLTQSNPDQIA